MADYTELRNINRGYMKLDVWQKSVELHRVVWETVEPTNTDYKLKSQIFDAVQSVSSNIAEGLLSTVNQGIHPISVHVVGFTL